MKLVKIEIQCLPFLDKRRKRKNGKFPIIISVTYKSKRTYVPTEILLIPELCDELNRKVKGDNPFAKRKNRLLFARPLEVWEGSLDKNSLIGHKQCKILGIYKNRVADLKNGGTNEGK